MDISKLKLVSSKTLTTKSRIPKTLRDGIVTSFSQRITPEDRSTFEPLEKGIYTEAFAQLFDPDAREITYHKIDSEIGELHAVVLRGSTAFGFVLDSEANELISINDRQLSGNKSFDEKDLAALSGLIFYGKKGDTISKLKDKLKAERAVWSTLFGQSSQIVMAFESGDLPALLQPEDGGAPLYFYLLTNSDETEKLIEESIQEFAWDHERYRAAKKVTQPVLNLVGKYLKLDPSNIEEFGGSVGEPVLWKTGGGSEDFAPQFAALGFKVISVKEIVEQFLIIQADCGLGADYKSEATGETGQVIDHKIDSKTFAFLVANPAFEKFEIVEYGQSVFTHG